MTLNAKNMVATQLAEWLQSALGLQTGETPFPWQERLVRKFLEGDIPASTRRPHISALRGQHAVRGEDAVYSPPTYEDVVDNVDGPLEGDAAIAHRLSSRANQIEPMLAMVEVDKCSAFKIWGEWRVELIQLEERIDALPRAGEGGGRGK